MGITGSAVTRPGRKKLLLPLGGFALLALIPGAVLLFSPNHPDTPQRLWSVTYSPDGKTLVTTGGPDSADGRIGDVVFWNASNGKKKRVLQQQSGIRRAVFSPGGKFIATADFGGKTFLLNAKTGETQAILTPQYSVVNAVAISADSKLIAGGTFNGTVVLWDTTGHELGILQAPREQILNLAISPDSRWVVSGCKSGKAYLFDVTKRNLSAILDAYEGPPSFLSGIEAVAFAPDGQTFVTGGIMLRLWKTATGRLIRELPPCNARLNCLAFSPDGHALAGVDRDGWLARWDAETGERTTYVHALDSPSFGLAYSPDGNSLATVSRTDFVVKIWYSESLDLRKTFQRGKPKS
jgi:WD40 repeat protein